MECNDKIEKIKEKLEGLQDGESYTLPETDCGSVEIWLKNGIYFI